MKKLIGFVLITLLIFTLTGCGSKPVDLAALKTEIDGGNLFIDEFVSIDQALVQQVIGVNVDNCVSAQFFIGTGNTGEEYGLFECKTKADAQALVTQLQTRRDENEALYSGYAPEAIPRIKNTVIRQSGVYVCYIAADKYDEAATIADKYFN